MDITEVRVKLIGGGDGRLKAFCSITLDSCFVVRDLKIIEGSNGIFVAMPSRKLADHCRKCGEKNHLRAKYCNECGGKLREGRVTVDEKGRRKLHADVAHPINAECRARIQDKVILAYEEELERAKDPDYKPLDLDEDYQDSMSDYDSLIAELKQEAAARRGPRDAETDGGNEPAPEDRQDRESGGGRNSADLDSNEPLPSKRMGRDMPSRGDAGSESDFGAGIL